MNCWHCHTCGTQLRSVLDGEEYCKTCDTYQRYRSHGWAHGENSPCPARLTPIPNVDEITRRIVLADTATAS